MIRWQNNLVGGPVGGTVGNLGDRLGNEPRFLITRLSAIGDCIHTVPLAMELRRAYPQAFIAWATQSAAAHLLHGLPCVDEIITIDRNWLARFRSIRETRSKLRSRQFDVCFDPQGLTKSSGLAWLSSAKVRIGFDRGQSRELAPWLNNYRVSPRKNHVVDRYLELLRPIGISNPQVTFEIPQPLQAIQQVDRFIERAQLGAFALINPGAGWDSKLWPAERYAQLANRLRDELGVPSVIVWSGDREREWAEMIAERSSSTLAPSTTLPELAELCRRGSFFVGSDTGPAHLAAAVGTPCVAMYGPTSPEVCGPYGPQHECLQVYLQDGSSRQRRGTKNQAMQAISVSMVFDACVRIHRGIGENQALRCG